MLSFKQHRFLLYCSLEVKNRFYVLSLSMKSEAVFYRLFFNISMFVFLENLLNI